ncbi:hypothetical protein EVAR_92700_1 [Eumeta japonica]|uniref:Uncharacterized protein n=1 Tax=Eumeta variegata TaxID=151549 RepID=A0A4C1T007_EUMVA|nr:hypothetical protein EVAR_92700_1 [Eumeta japonica]
MAKDVKGRQRARARGGREGRGVRHGRAFRPGASGRRRATGAPPKDVGVALLRRGGARAAPAPRCGSCDINEIDPGVEKLVRDARLPTLTQNTDSRTRIRQRLFNKCDQLSAGEARSRASPGGGARGRSPKANVTQVTNLPVVSAGYDRIR